MDLRVRGVVIGSLCALLHPPPTTKHPTIRVTVSWDALLLRLPSIASLFLLSRVELPCLFVAKLSATNQRGRQSPNAPAAYPTTGTTPARVSGACLPREAKRIKP